MAIELYLDGKSVTLAKSYNSRGRVVPSCFLAFYYDASDVTSATPHKLAIHFPPLAKGNFQGFFWENVETEYTSEVASCRVVVDQAVDGSQVYV